ncbi:hypothetical protein H0H87_006128 [Tephrocybe sp. NHM501043]|nr:hypothetical protein H0H87_006128 [Tephrocybe sp. NHM501043]
MSPVPSSSWQTAGGNEANENPGFISTNKPRNRIADSRGSLDTSRTPYYPASREDARVPAPSSLAHPLRAPTISPKPAPIPIPLPAVTPPLTPKKTPHDPPKSSLPSLPDSPPPHKRRRVEHSPIPTRVKIEDIEMTHAICSAPLPPPEVKAEQRTPSPVPPTRRLVTHACALYPLPENCRKIDPDYAKHRTALVTKERAVLKGKGLKATNVLFRDDGMVIEWTSPVPVWSDTLVPEIPTPPPEKVLSPKPFPLPKKRRKDQDNDAVASTSSSPPALPPSTAPAPLTQRTTPMPLPLPKPRPPMQEQDEAEEHSPPPLKKDKGKAKEVPLPMTRPRPRPLPLPKPRLSVAFQLTGDGVGSRDASPDIVEIVKPVLKQGANTDSRTWNADELEQFEPMAVDFLHRYIKAFDIGASALRPAYASSAFFSCRTLSKPQSVSTCQGRSSIKRALTRLSSYKFLPEGTARDMQVHYDVAPLGAEAGGGLLLTMHGEIVDSRAGSGVIMGLDQAFVLQKTNSEEGVWPLVAVSHQITIRELVGNGVANVKEFSWFV